MPTCTYSSRHFCALFQSGLPKSILTLQIANVKIKSKLDILDYTISFEKFTKTRFGEQLKLAQAWKI